MAVSVLIKDACSTVGEGPHWEPSTSSLLYVDSFLGELHKYNTVTATDAKVTLGGTTGFFLPREGGEYVVGWNRTLCSLNWKTGTVTPLAEVDIGCETLINDAKCDISGRLWTGTLAFVDGQFLPEKGALYSLGTDHSLKCHLKKINLSNGFAWSSDNRTMYYIDSTPNHLYAFDYDITSGNIENQRVAVDFNKFGADTGIADGMCIDQEGMLWVACFDAARVVRVDPNTGSVLRTLTFPAKKITSCCFGGPNFDELYVTSARMGCTAEDLSAYPLAGSVFKVKELGVKGGPAPEYRG